MSEAAREFYVSENGDRWMLGRDPASGRPHVVHIGNPASGGHRTHIDVTVFLGEARSHTPEVRALNTLLAERAAAPDAG